MNHHRLKCWPTYFAAIVAGDKPFDVRREDDRTFAVGDEITMVELDKDDRLGEPTGREAAYCVTYVLRGSPFLPHGLAVLGLRRLHDCEMLEALQLVTGERRRQVEVEGWSRDHDDAHGAGEIALAAAAYALQSGLADHSVSRRLREQRVVDALWPWEWSWWKPASPLRMLVKAGALILAEIERRLRAGERL